jgi:hypothetical protein
MLSKYEASLVVSSRTRSVVSVSQTDKCTACGDIAASKVLVTVEYYTNGTQDKWESPICADCI